MLQYLFPSKQHKNVFYFLFMDHDFFKMKTTYTFETSVPIYPATQQHIPGDLNVETPYNLPLQLRYGALW